MYCIVAKKFFMTTEINPGDTTHDNSFTEKLQETIAENIKITLEEASTELTDAETSFLLSYAIILYDLCT
jgi:hypothetical protein